LENSLHHSSDKSSKYRPDIDGLRAVAIISVVMFHANVGFIRGGFVGVDVFFVISGFLIGSLVFREMREQRFTFKRFYERRAKRILPALFVVVAFCFIPACLLLSGAELKSFAQETIAALTSSSNIYFAAKSDYFSSAGELHPLLMTWSLGIEEQFYFFFPVIMVLLIKFGRRHALSALAILSLLSFAVAMYGVTLYPAQAFYLLPSRAWELGLGTILGVYEVGHPPKDNSARTLLLLKEFLGYTGAAMLLCSIFLFSRYTLFPGYSALLPTVATVMLIRARSSWINTQILSAKPLVAIGLVSYSWYLWHWPLMSFARIAMAGVLPVSIGYALALLSLGLATISYYWIEQPFRKQSSSGTPILWRYGVVSLGLCIPATLLIVGNGWPGRYPEARKVDLANLGSEEDPCMVRFRDSKMKRMTVCQSSEPSQPILAVMGDSHAAALASSLRSAALMRGWRVDDFTKASCAQLGPVMPFLPSRRHHDTECATFNQRALNTVLSDPSVRTVLLAAYWTGLFPQRDGGFRFLLAGQKPSDVTEAESWANLETGLLKTTQLLRSGGKRVLLTIDVPRFRFDPVLAARSDAIPTRKALNRLLGGPDFTLGIQSETLAEQRLDRHADAIIERVANETGATIVDLPRSLCRESLCRFEVNGVPLYVDPQHLSVAGAKYVLQGADLFNFNDYIPKTAETGNARGPQNVGGRIYSSRSGASNSALGVLIEGGQQFASARVNPQYDASSRNNLRRNIY
jgi:peptidoglycan/LPS O-acetylase OafA/YrhL